MSRPTTTSEVPKVTDRRRTGIAVGAALVLVAVVTVVVAIFGVRRPPEFPLLGEQPDPTIPGTIAYVSNEPDGATCVHALPASGSEAPVELHCAEVRHGWIERLAWTESGDLVMTGSGLRSDPHAQEMLVVSYPEGSVLDQTNVDHLAHLDEPVERPDGLRVFVRGDRHGDTVSVVVSDDGDERTVSEIATDGRYELRSARWSPDGEWILVADSEGRLLVVGVDGGDPRVLLESEDDPWRWQEAFVAWHVPGESWQTVDPDDVRGSDPSTSEDGS